MLTFMLVCLLFAVGLYTLDRVIVGVITLVSGWRKDKSIPTAKLCYLDEYEPHWMRQPESLKSAEQQECSCGCGADCNAHCWLTSKWADE